MDTFVVHGSPLSPYVQAVLLVLAEKAVSPKVNPVGIGQIKMPAHLALHPFGRIPALEHGDFVLYETQAILRYVDRVVATPPLTPPEARRAARMDQVMNITDAYLFNGVVGVIGFHRVIAPMMGREPDLVAIEAAMPRAHTVLGVLDGMLAGQAFLAGEALSLGDLMAAPPAAMLARTPEWAALTQGRPNLVAWLARMQPRLGVVQG